MKKISLLAILQFFTSCKEQEKKSDDNFKNISHSKDTQYLANMVLICKKKTKSCDMALTKHMIKQ